MAASLVPARRALAGKVLAGPVLAGSVPAGSVPAGSGAVAMRVAAALSSWPQYAPGGGRPARERRSAREAWPARKA